jgi:hypothetical protein
MIKTYTILLAWSMIFAHSIIPHNHLDNCSGSFCGATHENCPLSDEQGKMPEFLSHSAEVNVCHLSGFIFHQFDQDNLISDCFENSQISPLSTQTGLNYHSAESVVTEHWNASASFRAPPIA